MALTKQQRRIARTIILEGERQKVNRKRKLASIAAGLVESELSNPKGGHGTSAGWRQEIDTYGSVKKRRNVKGAARRFFQETKEVDARGMTAGQLAQAVQRSAFPEKYDQRLEEAKRILDTFNKHGKKGKSRGRARKGGKKGKRATITNVSVPLSKAKTKVDYTSALTDKLLSGGKGSLFDTLLEAGEPGSPYIQHIPAKATKLRFKNAAQRDLVGGKGGKKGKGARPRKDGWYGSKSMAQPGYDIAKRFGFPISSEKRGTVNTASGNVSDHYEGNRDSWAVDIDTQGNDTKKGMKAARRIAKRYGMTFRPHQWNNKNVTVNGRTYRVQLGYGSGIDHADHIHLGLDRIDVAG